MANPPRILLGIETSSSYGRGVFRGVINFTHAHKPWELHKSLQAMTAATIREQGIDGVIGHIVSPQIVADLQNAGIPVVNVSGLMPESPFPRVTPDNRAVGRLAAEHLRSLGLEHFVFSGAMAHGYARRRLEGFREVLDGLPCDVLESADLASAAGWLSARPRPMGLFAANDRLGASLLAFCTRAGLRVPEDVALLGCDNDELYCETQRPPLSSIELGTDRVGYEAAGLMTRLLAGERVNAGDAVLLPPVEVVVRESTSAVLVPDPTVATAVRYIAAHAHEGIQVKHVLDAVGASRRWLEMRFEELLGRSPAEEIRRVRLEKARRILAKTDQSLAGVARACGFVNAKQFSRTFTNEIGQTPSDYRKRFRLA